MMKITAVYCEKCTKHINICIFVWEKHRLLNVKPGDSHTHINTYTHTYTHTYIHTYIVCLPLGFKGLSCSETCKCDISWGFDWNSSCYL